MFHVWQIFSKPKKHKICEEFLRKNSWIACLSARNFHALVDPARPQSYQSNQLICPTSTWLFDIFFDYFTTIETNNDFRHLCFPPSEAFWSEDFLHFHGFLTTFMKIFERFATKLHSETSGKPFRIDIHKVIIISGADFDTG